MCKLFNPKTGKYISDNGETEIRYYARLFENHFVAALYQRKNGLSDFIRVQPHL
jgi:hypothetical protein